MPDEIRQANLVIHRRDEILDEAQAKAKQMLESARLQAEQMLSESQLMAEVKREAEVIRQKVLTELDGHRKKAFEEAEAMKAKAYEEARATKLVSDEYAEAVLASLDKNLAEFHHQVKNGLKQLRHNRQEAAKSISPWNHRGEHQRADHHRSEYRLDALTPAQAASLSQQTGPASLERGGSNRSPLPKVRDRQEQRYDLTSELSRRAALLETPV